MRSSCTQAQSVEEYACNAGDRSWIPLGWKDPREKEMATHSVYLQRIHEQREPRRSYNLGDHKSRTRLATKPPPTIKKNILWSTFHSPALSTLQEPNTWMRQAKGRTVVTPGSISHPVSERMEEVISRADVAYVGLKLSHSLLLGLLPGRQVHRCKRFLQWAQGPELSALML